MTVTIPVEQMQAIAEMAAKIAREQGGQVTAIRSKYVTPQEAAEQILCCKRARVYNLCSRGELTKHYDGGRVLLLREEVEEYVARTARRVA